MSQTTARTIALLLFIFSFQLAFAGAPPPSNDDCGGAVVLTLGVINTNGTVKAANASAGIPIGSCTGTPDDDVWYKFTLSSTTSITVTLSSIGGNLNTSGAMVQLLSGTCSPLSFSSITCGNTEVSAANLTSGTYYIRVYSAGNTAINSGDGFSITVTGPPSNDDCAGAVTLMNGVTNSSGTVWNASASSSIPTGCATGNPDDDVWYKFTATATIASIDLSSIGSDLSSSGAMIQMFTGTCGGSFASYACGNTNLTTAVTNGTIYYVRIYSLGTGSLGSTSTGSIFSITAAFSTPPSNDDCSSAVTLTNGVTNSSGTVWSATASSGIPTGCASGTPDDDVWYKFTATSSNVNIVLSGLGSNLSLAGAMLQLFSGSCGSLVSMSCGYTGLSTTSLTSGNVYYVRVYSSVSGSIGGTSSGSDFSITVSNASTPSSTTVTGSRMNEVFKLTTISTANNLNYPWEVTHGPDGYLWITEARGYKVVRMDPNTGLKNTVLDISQNSPFLPSSDQSFNLQFDFAGKGNPQGGLAGLALHPLFLDPVTPKNYVYVSYIHTWVSGSSSGSTEVIYVNRLVRFEYNTTTGFLQNPISLCDTLPGSSDHNSQRMIIAPVGGTYYLFYASGDMGGGQYSNKARTIKSQDQNSYEGKILRFNLEPVSGSWIPSDNPFGNNSAVWSTGIRNNQGFAYATINGTGYLYGSSHGPYSDDEINIIEKGKNYGHPLVVGYSSDGNYDGVSVGQPGGSAPLITSEAANAAAIGASYKDPIFTFYSAPKGNTTTPNTITYMWTNNPSNNGWPSEAPSGLDIYTNTIIPGWKNSLVSGALKWGRLMREKLNGSGTGIIPTNGYDTASYFENPNRYRDLAFSPDGKDIYIVMDNNSATSGPGTDNPSIVNCAGCVHKYTFLGYADASGKSSIPTSIDVTDGTVNTCNTGTTITIDATNNNIWVPITGPDGNIMAEIYANGNNLGTVTSSFYQRTGPSRVANGKPYLNRNIRITPQNQPSTAVKIRLYISKAEYDTLDRDPLSLVNAITDVKILKNNDACGSSIASNTSPVTMLFEEVHGGNGYMLQGSITSFSSFYFGNSSIILPLQLLTFKGSLQNNASELLWETANEINVSHFVIERSIDNRSFTSIGSVTANGAGTTLDNKYAFTDNDVINQSSSLVYYRLKMVDIDGNYTYSSIVVITLPYITGKITIFPNPATHEIKVTIGALVDGKVQYNLADNTGRVVIRNSLLVKRGNNVITIKIDKLTSGFYYLRVLGDGINQRVKLEKL